MDFEKAKDLLIILSPADKTKFIKEIVKTHDVYYCDHCQASGNRNNYNSFYVCDGCGKTLCRPCDDKHDSFKGSKECCDKFYCKNCDTSNFEDVCSNCVRADNEKKDRMCNFRRVRNQKDHAYIGKAYTCENCKKKGCKACLEHDCWKERVKDNVFLCVGCREMSNIIADIN